MMIIKQLYTNCLAEAAYYIESDGEAAIVDPIRETEPYIELAAVQNSKIKYIFETHFHADFVSGHIDLASKTGAQIVYGPNANTAYKVYNAVDGERFRLGSIEIEVLHTPGHTMESTCYLVYDENKKPYAVLTGDTLFVGDVGRPDLLDGSGIAKEVLAGLMFDSLNNKIKTLPDEVLVYPAHGPGSACGKNIGKETWSSIGQQKKTNYALLETNKDRFIKTLCDGLAAPPMYFFEDARINKSGYTSIDAVVKRNTRSLSLEEFEEEVAKGAVILDSRSGDHFEKGFIPGSVNIGLNGQFANWVGTLIHIEMPIILVTEKGKEHETVLRAARVGYENIKGYLDGGIQTWIHAGKKTDTISSIHADEFSKEMQTGKYKSLDVRKPSEFEVSHVEGTIFLTLADIPANYNTLDKNTHYLVYCGGGYRSMVAVSILKQHGFTRLTNVYGGFGKIKNCGFPLTSSVNT